MSLKHSMTALFVGVLWLHAPGFANGPPRTTNPERDEAPADQATRLESVESRLAERPDDLALINAYKAEAFARLRKVVADVRRGPEALERASRLVERVGRIVQGLTPPDDAGRQAVAEMSDTLDFYRRLIAARRHTFDELRRTLDVNPDDLETMLVYEVKLQSEHDAMNESEATLALLSANKEYLAALKGKAASEKVREVVAGLIDATIPRVERQAREALRVRREWVGRDAPPPLAGVQAWVNGGPLAPANLRGRVVLLEFWAVWCGPCIRLFPDLARLHHKYADRGLMVIGVTGYHNYVWDDKTDGPVQSPAGDVPSEREERMLAKFVSRHKLPYRTAVEKGRTLSDAYGVQQIPRTVLIDRRGKVRLIHFGAGRADAIDEMIGKLLAEGPAER